MICFFLLECELRILTISYYMGYKSLLFQINIKHLFFLNRFPFILFHFLTMILCQTLWG